MIVIYNLNLKGILTFAKESIPRVLFILTNHFVRTKCVCEQNSVDEVLAVH